MRRITPAVALLFLAPWVGEYLLGNVPMSAVLALPFLAPMYGGGAVLIREVARRTGRKWPTIFMLAMAYGVLEPTLLDQSMFNPSYMGHAFLEVTPIPFLGISASNAVTFVFGHAIWSISVPIAIVETLAWKRRTEAWLGKVGLSVMALVLVFGSWVIYSDQRTREQYDAAAPKKLASAAVIVALIAIAFTTGRRELPNVAGRVPVPGTLGAIALVYSTLYFARPETWIGFGLGILMLAIAAVVVVRWSRRDGWDDRHRFALVGGTLLTYTWAGFFLVQFFHGGATIDVIGNVINAVFAFILIVLGARAAPRRPSDSIVSSAVPT